MLAGGTIYTSWTSHCDEGAYGGWLVAYSESTLSQTGAVNLGPGASGTGYAAQGPAIWMSGGGPAVDSSGNLYVLMANGPFETTLNSGGFPSGGDYGNSFVKLSATGGTLAVADYFTLKDGLADSANDVDLGSGGIMLLPDVTDATGTTRHLVVGAGKDGNLYVVSRDSMGKFSGTTNNIWQELDGALTGGVWSTAAWFNGNAYYGPSGGALRAFSMTNAMLAGSATSQTATTYSYPVLRRWFPRTARAMGSSGPTRTPAPEPCCTPTMQRIWRVSSITATRRPMAGTSSERATSSSRQRLRTARFWSRRPIAWGVFGLLQ